MEYKFEKKFGEKHIDHFISSFYNNYKSNLDNEYIFNLENIEWISNQGLLLLTSLLKFLYTKEVKFKIIFFELNNTQTNNYRRKITNIVNLWEVWKINRVVPDDYKWNEYFSFKNSKLSFTPTLLASLKKQFNINADQNLYSRLRITPFVELEKINKYVDEKIIDTQISPIFKLNNEISNQLRENNCEHPFLNNTLSHIITKELYENFLDHVSDSFFQTEKNWAFMSLSLKRNFTDDNQYILKKNFEEEELESTKNFFYQNGKYLNNPIIEYSFLDFGEGIVSTLRENFKENFETDKVDDNEILKYSFEYYSSRHPIKKYNNNDDAIIPRGLYDVLTIIKRYSGLMIIRSNYGRILFDYSSKDTTENIKFFGSNSEFFPGTFITIYLPAFDVERKFDSSSIKPQVNDFKNKTPLIRYISLNEIYNKIIDTYSKDDLYNKLIEYLIETIKNDGQDVYINCISFNGCNDERLNKVALFFLLTNYAININNNVIIFYPPNKAYIDSIKAELINLSTTIKNFIIHPIPLIYAENDIDWLGIFNIKDKENLSHFFDESVVKSIDDFHSPDELLGNFQYLENQRNLYSLISKIDIPEALNTLLVKNIIDRNNCIRKDGLYLCNGNYYQEEFLQLSELLNNEDDCKAITSILFDKIGAITTNNYFIAITSSSHKILDTLIKMDFITKDKCLFLDSYLTFEQDIKTKEIIAGNKYILLGDVLSGGSLAKRLEVILSEKGSELEKIAVLINTVDENYENSILFLEKYKDKIEYAYKYSIRKYKRQEIDVSRLKDVIRINPFTNLPNIFSDKKTLKESIVFSHSNKRFLDYIDDNNIIINYKIFNNLVHPYFFNLKEIIKNENYLIQNTVSKSLFNYIFNIKLKDKISLDNPLKIFYPKGSDLENLDFDNLKSKIFNNHSVKIFELERFNIKEGWKFPHITDTYDKLIFGENVLIIDDGSCSGDSLLQMINELVYFRPKKIDVISLVGRVNDHKREFFSRIKQMRFEDESVNESIDINIYFVCHWHIPTFYTDNSPFTEEISWIKQILEFQNLPTSIKSIAGVILKTILPKENIDDDYAFLPIDRDTKKVPKKEIIIIRDEIGKVIGYRFYKENFIFFNEFIRKYTDNVKSADRYKDVELLSMCLLYEPYIYEKISNVMPDVKEKIEEFIDSVFFGIGGRQRLDISMLYYDWTHNKRDLLHLFFIIYSNEQKLKQLNNEKFKILLDFASLTFKKINPSNYILYKLLRFFPLSKDEIVLKNRFSFLKDKLLSFIEDTTNDIDSKTKLEFKRFYSFLNTLPTANDFNSQLQKIRDLYWNNDQPKLHDDREAYSINFSIIISSLRELKDSSIAVMPLDKEKVNLVKESWWNIKNTLLDPLISFFRSYEDFFKPYPYLIYYNKIDGKEKSLITLYTFVEDFINNIEQKNSDIENFNKSIKFVEFIDDKFGSENDEFRDLFKNSTVQFQVLKNKLITSLSALKNHLKLTQNTDIDFEVYLPEKYIDKIIIQEIINNLTFYSDETKEIELALIKRDNIIEIKLQNYYLEKVNEFSSNEGINCLNLLSESPIFNFKYDYTVDKVNKKFIQKLIFNL